MGANVWELRHPVRRPLHAALILVALVASAPGWSADSASATASATILAPMTISSATNLSFGSFDASRAGTVTVDTAGNRSASGVTLSGGTPAAATFSIAGQAGLSYNIAYTGTSATLSNGSDAMGLSIVSDLGGAASSAGETVSSGTLNAGPTTLRVGGTLTVQAGTPPGSYNGNISVTVQYQ
jgi:spore coat protein U-like protein